jgi:hypothetical protein
MGLFSSAAVTLRARHGRRVELRFGFILRRGAAPA